MITDRGLMKILNFGLAPPSINADAGANFTLIDAAAYLSPEQLRDEDTDQRTDIWSWGVVFYEMLTGKLPFKGEGQKNVIHAILNDEPPLPSEMNIEVPAKLDRIITRALAKSLQDRYQNISEIMAELQAPEISLQVTDHFEDLPNQTQPSIAVLAFED